MDNETNQILSQVGAGTPMGELMRRYWHPIAAVAQLEDKPVMPVRLMGEDLVLYKDFSGNYGLVDRQCAHRRADLSYGFVENVGLRCNYHGWLYDHKGEAIERPFEDTARPEFRGKVQASVRAYRAAAKAGLVWAYMGPEPAPLVPNWEPFTWANGFVQIVFSEIPCNWFQCQENSIDPVHFEWMHENWSIRQKKGADAPYGPKHLKIEFDEFDWGMVYKRIREDTDEKHPLWTIGRVCLWPHALFTGSHFEWRVPIDDHTTLSVGWFFNRVPNDCEPYVQQRIPYWVSPIRDEKTGRWITSHTMNQDYVAWVGQGVIADRTREHLGLSDRGIAMMRKRFLADIDIVKAGGDPKAVVRDEKTNQCLALPMPGRKPLVDGLSREAFDRVEARNSNSTLGATGMREFVWLVGQPEEIKREYNEAMGWKLTVFQGSVSQD